MKRKLTVILALACLMGAATAQKETAAERQDDLYRRATDLYQKQKYAAAQQIYDQIAAQGTSGRADLTTADACY